MRFMASLWREYGEKTHTRTFRLAWIYLQFQDSCSFALWSQAAPGPVALQDAGLTADANLFPQCFEFVPTILMKQRTEKQMLLTDVLPAFATELRQLLIEKGEQELAAQVQELMILDRCRCGDDFCTTFYTRPRPQGGFGPGHRNVALTPDEGMLILDVVLETIACVEVLDRDELRQKLQAALP